MKKIITGAFVLALTIGAAKAQTTSPDNSKDHRKEYKMKEWDKLNLTADQKAKMKSLHEQQKTEMEALKKNGNVTREQRMELHQKYSSQMQSILTPQQQEQWKSLQEARKDNRKGDFRKGQGFSAGDSTHMGRKGDFRKREDFQKQLNLSAEQQEKMDRIRADFKSQFEALRNDKSLSDADRKTKMQELRKAQQKQMKTVLTKEQMEKMQSLRKEHAARNSK
ncbi:MAG: hypothetical protein ACXVBT_01600 [Flavisolibacter sp.]